ncbi:dynamin family protein [Streptomyces massasporeus]|uniref:dynamin family protein n=1 Tax=Streptomyces massasporeus TaxID=67324 RepID=UPI003686C1B5
MSGERTAVLRMPRHTAAVTGLAAAAGIELPAAPPLSGTVAVVGPRGSGKTTLLRALLGGGPAGALALAAAARQWHGPTEYVYGAGPGIEVHGCAADGWRPAFPVGPQREATEARFRRMRVHLPCDLLAGGLRVLDLPGFDGALSDLAEYAEELADPAVGVLYVLPHRGVTELDVQAFEALRGRQPVVVQAIRDDQLLPRQSLLELVSVPVSDWPYALPLVVSEVTGHGGATSSGRGRAALMDCLAVLRAQALPPGIGSAVLEWSAQVAPRLSSAISDRMSAIHHDARVDATVRRVAAWGELARALRDCRTLLPADGVLKELCRDAQQTRFYPVSFLRPLVARSASELVDHCNIRAGRQGAEGDAPLQAPKTDFAHRYLQARASLHGMVCNLAAHAAELGLTQEERNTLRTLRHKSASECIEIAMLGQFSSGKSSLINAIVEQRFGDRVRKLLPTSVRAETATVNIVTWAEQEQVLGVDWRTKADLCFLARERDEETRFRVRADEIEAFASWLRTGQVAPADCTFWLVKGHPEREAMQAGDKDMVQHFHRTVDVLRELGAHGKLPDYVYPHGANDPDGRTLPERTVVTRVEVRKFAATPWTETSKPLTPEQAFERIGGDLGISLRVGKLRIGYPLELLKYVTLIDTPGTDAPKPHHAEITHSILSESKCTVLCCLPADRAAAQEDEKNLRRILRYMERDSRGLERLFVAVTAVDLKAPEELPEIRQSALKLLKRLGVESPKLYLTDVKNRNTGFQDLVRDLGRFAEADRRPYLLAWTRQLHNLLTEADRRCVAEVAIAHADEAARRTRLAELDVSLTVLVEIRKDAETSAEWGLPRLRKRVEKATSLNRQEVSRLVNGLEGPDTYRTVEDDLQNAFRALNDSADKAVAAQLALMADEIRSRIEDAGITASISDPPTPSTGTLFPVARVAAAARAAHWRTRWQKTKDLFAGRSEGSDTVRNRNRMVEAWGESDAAGRQAMKERAKEGGQHLTDEIARLINSLLAERSAQARPMSKARLGEIARIRKDLERWQGRLAAFERTLENEERHGRHQ